MAAFVHLSFIMSKCGSLFNNVARSQVDSLSGVNVRDMIPYERLGTRYLIDYQGYEVTHIYARMTQLYRNRTSRGSLPIR